MITQLARHQLYELHRTRESSTSLDQPFVLTEISDGQRRQEFDNFEQVLNFLLDDLLGEPGTNDGREQAMDGSD